MAPQKRIWKGLSAGLDVFMVLTIKAYGLGERHWRGDTCKNGDFG
jgi:hypothetical protein